MIEWSLRLVSRLMSRVRVNRIEWRERDGVAMIVKRRRFGCSIVIWWGNLFLSLSRSDSRMFVSVREWIAWERHCVELLYPRAEIHTAGSGSELRTAAMPGVSLRKLLTEEELSFHAVRAAARELQRCHSTSCSYFEGGWSHGDLHLDNVLYDQATDQAFLIDFDTRHQAEIHEDQRQSDDLAVFLLELISSSEIAWPELARVLLDESGDVGVLGALIDRLVVPRGWTRLLWYTRTGCRPVGETAPRLDVLKEMIRQLVDTSA